MPLMYHRKDQNPQPQREFALFDLFKVSSDARMEP
jgi:hypothetical protein